MIAGKECILKATSVKAVKIGEIKEVGNDKTLFAKDYDENWNQKFKENFYKEKGLIKCWVSDCQNKIYQNALGIFSYRKVKVPCQESHTRMVCLECSKKYE